MLVVNYLQREYDEYKTDAYRELYEFFKNLNHRLAKLHNEYYMKMYKYCVDYTYTEYFQDKGLGIPIFKYKSVAPYSSVFANMASLDIKEDKDLLQFEEFYKEDLANLIELNNAVESAYFIKMFGDSTLYHFTKNFCEEMSMIYADMDILNHISNYIDKEVLKFD